MMKIMKHQPLASFGFKIDLIGGVFGVVMKPPGIWEPVPATSNISLSRGHGSFICEFDGSATAVDADK